MYYLIAEAGSSIKGLCIRSYKYSCYSNKLALLGYQSGQGVGSSRIRTRSHIQTACKNMASNHHVVKRLLQYTLPAVLSSNDDASALLDSAHSFVISCHQD